MFKTTTARVFSQLIICCAVLFAACHLPAQAAPFRLSLSPNEHKAFELVQRRGGGSWGGRSWNSPRVTPRVNPNIIQRQRQRIQQQQTQQRRQMEAVRQNRIREIERLKRVRIEQRQIIEARRRLLGDQRRQAELRKQQFLKAREDARRAASDKEDANGATGSAGLRSATAAILLGDGATITPRLQDRLGKLSAPVSSGGPPEIETEGFGDNGGGNSGGGSGGSGSGEPPRKSLRAEFDPKASQTGGQGAKPIARLPRQLESKLRHSMPPERWSSRDLKRLSILRKAQTEKGFYGLGAVDRAMADDIGRAWVGPNARLSKSGMALVSQDGLRQYRLPAEKNRSREATTGVQANIESRSRLEDNWTSNGHLDIID